MQQGYYTNRMKALEERKEEVTKQYVTAKLTLKGINKELEKCIDYMNSANYTEKEDTSEIEKKVIQFEHKVLSLENKIKTLKKTISNKDTTIIELNEVINDKEHEISVLKLKNHNDTVKFQNEIADLNIQLNENRNLKIEKYVNEMKSIKKENRSIKRDNKALHERISLMDKTIEKKNNEIRILHERLNWQPVASDKQLEAK